MVRGILRWRRTGSCTICCTWDEATSDPGGIDVVVIGAGMYGAYCASKIYELSRERFWDPKKALRVFVLEAGPFVLPEHTQNVSSLGFYDPGIASPIDVGAGSRSGIRNEVWGVGWRSNQPFVGLAYCIGGKSLFGGGWCPRLEPSDLTQWPKDIEQYAGSSTRVPACCDRLEDRGQRPDEGTRFREWWSA